MKRKNIAYALVEKFGNEYFKGRDEGVKGNRTVWFNRRQDFQGFCSSVYKFTKVPPQYFELRRYDASKNIPGTDWIIAFDEWLASQKVCA